MISLEGLTMITGRQVDAGYILRTFAHYVRDGLIPNLFPEGQHEGLYHTADATLWFFHALSRYLDYTQDHATLASLLPKLREIIDHHLRGTRFGIGVDSTDGLLRQGADGFQLTWMDAKVGDWVVTPRRGKAVEINALWYNALRLMEHWVAQEEGEPAAAELGRWAAMAQTSFNKRFWSATDGYLYDVVDGPGGDDPACRPNQVLSFSLEYPVLDRAYWEPVLQVVQNGCSPRSGCDRWPPAIPITNPATTAICALAMQPTIRERYGDGSSAPLSMPGFAFILRNLTKPSVSWTASRPIWPRPASGRSARFSMPSRPTRRAVASPRRGA